MRQVKKAMMKGYMVNRLELFKHYIGRAPALGERLIMTKVTVFSNPDSNDLAVERMTDFRFIESHRVTSEKAKNAIRGLWADLNAGKSRAGWKQTTVRGRGGVVAVVFWRYSVQVQR